MKSGTPENSLAATGHSEYQLLVRVPFLSLSSIKSLIDLLIENTYMYFAHELGRLSKYFGGEVDALRIFIPAELPLGSRTVCIASRERQLPSAVCFLEAPSPCPKLQFSLKKKQQKRTQ